MSPQKSDSADKILRAFVNHNPDMRYTFDSERDSPISELCREEGPRGRECITMQMNSKRLFEAMQTLGFFCALPIEPGRTYMECKPLPK